MEKNKNGELEFLKYVFVMIVLLFHFNKKFSMNIFGNGRLGVQFLFMVTGLMLAKSVQELRNPVKSISKSAWGIIGREIYGFLPYYSMAVVIKIVYMIFVQHRIIAEVAREFIQAIPRFLFIDSFGYQIGGDVTLSIDWYLSAMVAAIFLILPLLLFNFEWSTKYICPLISIIGFGYLFKKYNTVILNADDASSLINPLLLRGLCNVSLGVWGYSIASQIKQINITTLSKVLLTILKWIFFGLVIVFANSRYSPSKYTFTVIACLLLGISLSFSDITYNIPYNKVTAFLGKVSLPMYLIHLMLRTACIDLWGQGVNVSRIVIWTVVLLAPVITYVYMVFTDYIWKVLKGMKKHIVNE